MTWTNPAVPIIIAMVGILLLCRVLWAMETPQEPRWRVKICCGLGLALTAIAAGWTMIDIGIVISGR